MSGVNKLGGPSTPIIPDNPPDHPPVGDGTPAGGTPGAAPVGGATPTPPAAPGLPVGNVAPPPVTTPTPTASPLDRPKIVIPAAVTGASMGDLIEMIQDEIQKTSDALASIQKIQIQEDSSKQQQANKDQITKLNSAADQIEQAAEMQKDMEIVQWVIFAVMCAVAWEFMGPVGAALTALTQVPIEGQNMMGWLTTGVGDALGDIEKDIEDDINDDSKSITGHGIKSDDDIKSDDKQIEDSQGYQAMAVMTYLTIAISVITIVASLGTAAPEAVGADVDVGVNEGLADTEEIVNEVVNEIEEEVEEEVEETVTETTKTATDAVKQALGKAKDVAQDVKSSVQEVMQETKQVQRLYNAVNTIVQTASTITQSSMGIYKGYLDEENSENQADADKIKAYTKFLQNILSQEEDFLKEIINSQSNIANTVKDVLQTEHSTNMHIANLTTHA